MNERAVALRPLIMAHAQWNDEHCQLAPEVSAAMAAAGMYRSALPECAGGPGIDPMQQMQLIETVAEADGATGWNLMIGIENYGLVAPHMTACAGLLEDPRTVICSSTAAVGRADPVAGGYQISGRWPFVSGCQNSALFAGTILRDPSDPSSRGYALLTREQFQIDETWQVTGMRGSGSHDVLVQDVRIPAERIIDPMGGGDRDDPLLRFPLGPRLTCNKAAVAFGILRAGIEEFIALAAVKIPKFRTRALSEGARSARALAEALLALEQSRAWLTQETTRLWQATLACERPTERTRARYQLAASGAVAACARAMAALGSAAGTTANAEGTRLNRCLRDLPVVGSHFAVAPDHIADAGRVLLGLPPQGMMLKHLR